jgi:hypothetical protein
MEKLTDRQAADAVRSRLDWKYCLSLELTDAGFDHTVLSEFRTRLVALSAEERFARSGGRSLQRTRLAESARAAADRLDTHLGQSARQESARAHTGYALADFSIDWEHEQARCPQGQKSHSWTPTWTRKQEIIKIKFGFAICGACPVRAQCTKAKRRSLSVRRQEAHFALEAARQRAQTDEFKQA